jgi:streptogramin lyase
MNPRRLFNPLGQRSLKLAASALLSLALLTGSAAADASAVSVPSGFTALGEATHLASIAFGPEGMLWGLESRSPGMYQAAEVFLTARPTNGSPPEVASSLSPQAAFAPGLGAVWYGERSLVRSEPDGASTTFRVPASGTIGDLAVGSDGSVWATTTRPSSTRTNAAIIRLGPEGDFTRFPLGRYAEPTAIVAGPSGDAWFLVSSLEGSLPALARITASGKVDRLPLPGGGPGGGYLPPGGVGDLAVSTDDVAWISDGVAVRGRPRARIAKVTPGGEISVYRVPGRESPSLLTAGSSGLIWFATEFGKGLGIDSIGPDGDTGAPSCIQPEASYCELAPYSIAADPAGNLWIAAGRSSYNCGGGGACEFTSASIEQESGYLGKFDPPQSTFALGFR